MFISILIPVYNKENYLNECIKSVISQTYDNFEIIIINDGSNDNSEKIILEWLDRDDRIRYYKHTNAGVSQTRNRGIDLAKGEYIFFLDADDELTPNALQSLVNNAKEYQSDIVMGNYIHVYSQDSKKRPQPTKYKYSGNDLYSTNTKIELFITSSRLLSMVTNKLYRLDFIKKHNIRFDTDVLAEDRLFNLKSYVYRPIITAIKDYTYLYNHLEESRSQSLKSTFYEESIGLLCKFNDYLKDTNQCNANNIELMELSVIYDVFKIINMTFEKSEHRYRSLYKITKKLRSNKVLMDNLDNIFQNKKYKGINNRAFNRMRLLSYLLYKWPLIIMIYKYLGAIKKKIES